MNRSEPLHEQKGLKGEYQDLGTKEEAMYSNKKMRISVERLPCTNPV